MKTLFLVALLSLAGAATAEPLSLNNRTVPGLTPGDTITFRHPNADSVTMQHSGTDWAVAVPMNETETPDVWTLSVAELGWQPGSYEFKFLINGNWEDGPNRYAYLNTEGQIVRPPALYLTWQRDPTTTITIHWHSDDAADPSVIAYKDIDAPEWQEVSGHRQPFPDTDRFIHTAEITGLTPDTEYAFRHVDQEITYRFRTLPSDLSRPVRFLQGGDIYHEGPPMDRMNSLAGSLDPDFVVIGGDLAYVDGRPENVLRWLRYFESFYHRLRSPDGRLIPVVVAIGNHEMQSHYLHNHDDYEPGPAWQMRVAPYFYRLFAMPGLPGYTVLDIGDYASFILLDSGHTSPVAGEQADWLAARLAERKDRPHVFPVYHVPAYPSVRDHNGRINSAIRAHWVPHFEEYGIRLAFEHHDHTLKITHPLRAGRIDPDGIVYLGDGAWSVNLRTPRTPKESPYFRLTAATNHLFEVILEPHQRTIRTIAISGAELDVFTQPAVGY